MVSSPPAKRKRQTGQQVEGAFEVEEVLGHKLVNHELRFFIKWKGYDQTHNTWEPMDNLVNCTVFRQFINSKFKALETVSGDFRAQHNVEYFFDFRIST